MQYSQEVENMCPVAKGAYHGPAPIPEEGKWVQAKEISDISGLTHGVGWCAPQQGACKLTLNVKDGIIEEALVETIGCSGMTHSAAMASEILPGKTILEALNTDLVCDAINVAMREIFLQIVYGRSQTAFSEGGLPVGASLDDLGKGLRSQVGTMFGTREKGPRYLEMAEREMGDDFEFVKITQDGAYREAAELMKLTAPELKQLGVIDGIVREPEGGAQTDPSRTLWNLDRALTACLESLLKESAASLTVRRYQKFRALGRGKEDA